MKNKVWKKVLCSLLATTMVVGLAACGNNDPTTKESQKTSESKETIMPAESSVVESKEEEKPMYPIEGDVTLTLAMLSNATVHAGAEHLFATPLGKAWMEATGVNIEVIELNDYEALNLMIASGELPDLMYFQTSAYKGGGAKLVVDGVVEPMNDYMEFAPDLQEVLNSNDVWRKSITTPEGAIIGAPFIRGDQMLNVSAGMMIRQDWLDDLKMDVPQTADDLYDALKAFKEQKGAAAPLTVTDWWLNWTIEQGLITSPFNLVKGNWYQENGTVHLGWVEKEYKDVLVYLNKLYDEELLDVNFTANDNSIVLSNMASGVSGVTIGSQGSVLGNILTAVEADNPTYDLTGFGSLVAKEGDIPYSGHSDNALNNYTLVMTSQCENKEAAVKFMNYGYTEEGYMLLNFGIEGESYTMVDGYPTYTELITNNPDGLSMQQALAQYTRSWADGPMVQDRRYMEQYAARPQQKAALAQWANTRASEYQMPSVSFGDEALSEYNKLWADISTFISEMRVKYITGQASLDNFETEYLGELEKMEIKRVIELYQEALDDFNAR